MNAKEEGDRLFVQFLSPQKEEDDSFAIELVNRRPHVEIQDTCGILSKCNWEKVLATKTEGRVTYECLSLKVAAAYGIDADFWEGAPEMEIVVLVGCRIFVSQRIGLRFRHVKLIDCIFSNYVFFSCIAPYVEEFHGSVIQCCEKFVYAKLHTLEYGYLRDSNFGAAWAAADFPALKYIVNKEMYGWHLDGNGKLQCATQAWELLAYCKAYRNAHRTLQVTLYLCLKQTVLLKVIIGLICHKYVPFDWCLKYVPHQQVRNMSLQAPGGMTKEEYEVLKEPVRQIEFATDCLAVYRSPEDIKFQEDRLAANKAMFNTFVKRRKIKSRK